jgi:hypothetical protein
MNNDFIMPSGFPAPLDIRQGFPSIRGQIQSTRGGIYREKRGYTEFLVRGLVAAGDTSPSLRALLHPHAHSSPA